MSDNKYSRVQKKLKDMSNMCCNCRRKLNRELSDEDDAFDSIVLGLYLSSRTRPKPETLTEQQLEKFLEQMDEMSENYGKRQIEEIREIYRHKIKKDLILINSRHDLGLISDGEHQHLKDRLKILAERYNIKDFENLPYQETVDILELERQKQELRLAELFNKVREEHGEEPLPLPTSLPLPGYPSPVSPPLPVFVQENTFEPPALINCSFKDGKESRRERRAQERMKKKQNKRY